MRDSYHGSTSGRLHGSPAPPPAPLRLALRWPILGGASPSPKPLREPGVALTDPLHRDSPAVVALRIVAQRDGEPLLRQRPRHPLRPLDEDRAVAPHEVEEARRVELVEIVDPVEVRVVDGEPAAVGRHDGEAGGADLSRGDLRAATGAPDELRLPGPELADERDAVPRPQRPAELRAERRGCRGRARHELQARPDGHRCHSAQTAPIDAATSPARSPRSPERAAARSPARPWIQAAALAAEA